MKYVWGGYMDSDPGAWAQLDTDLRSMKVYTYADVAETLFKGKDFRMTDFHTSIHWEFVGNKEVRRTIKYDSVEIQQFFNSDGRLIKQVEYRSDDMFEYVYN